MSKEYKYNPKTGEFDIKESYSGSSRTNRDNNSLNCDDYLGCGCGFYIIIGIALLKLLFS